MIAESNRWHKTIMAAVAVACLGLYGLDATALSLGRITVQSALGEPLRAEIDIPDMNAAEAASLKVSVALPEAFHAAGLDYNPAMTSLQATLQRRQDGRAYLRLRSERSINDPFVDMILEANWATGRIVRDYTLLFDPPNLRQSAAASPTPSQVPPPAAAALPAGRTLAPGAEPGRSADGPGTRPMAPRQASTKAPLQSGLSKSPGPQIGQVTVKSGDTAGKIAAKVKPVNVSLDQMLVALLRANPQAFIHDNVNRIKAGAVMTVPTTEQAQATPAAEAAQIVIAQSKDFNYFRRELAGNAPDAQVIAAERKASGKVQAQVEDKKPTTAAPDKLTLSKGAVAGKALDQQPAQDRSAAAAAARAVEISKNISDLAKLGAASGAVSDPTATQAAVPASATRLASPVPALPTIATSSAPVSTTAGAAKPVASAAPPASAAKPAASVIAKGPGAIAQPPSEPGLVNELIDNPLAPAGALGLIALLAGFGYYRFRQRKHAAQGDSAFLEGRLQPDSFFGASGGQSVDTSDSAATGSSMVYSPSQLDAVDDVDPVAEADVYLAYGRDLQAEEILKDALRTNPERIAIHQKLLAIFAKRRDTNAFEATAVLAFKLCKGEGSEWEQISELGLSIDPDNAFYQPGGQPNNPDGTPSRPAPLDFTLDGAGDNAAASTQALAAQPSGSTELDLDLDFSLDEHPVSAIREASASAAQAATQAPAEVPSTATLDLDFGLEDEAALPFEATEATVKIKPVNFSLTEPDTARSDLAATPADSEDFKQQASASFGATTTAALPAPGSALPAKSDTGMLEFDLGSLSLDLGDVTSADESAAPGAPEDPLATKLALADEFRDIGDDDGARALIQEVISEATGDMKIKAQRALSQL